MTWWIWVSKMTRVLDSRWRTDFLLALVSVTPQLPDTGGLQLHQCTPPGTGDTRLHPRAGSTGAPGQPPAGEDILAMVGLWDTLHPRARGCARGVCPGAATGGRARCSLQSRQGGRPGPRAGRQHPGGGDVSRPGLD